MARYLCYDAKARNGKGEFGPLPGMSQHIQVRGNRVLCDALVA